MESAPEALERKVLAYVRKYELLHPGDRVAAAVSGGADSVALLRLMLSLRAELGIVLSVAHFNHKIRGEASDLDERFVRNLAETYGLEFHFSFGDAPAHAQQSRQSLEAAARDLRYSFFRQLISSGAVSKVMTAHTLDDQAETVLMRMIRGTGTAGLAGIYPRVKIECGKALCGDGAVPRPFSDLAISRTGHSPVPQGNAGEIIRPLLNVRRCEIEDYLRSLRQTWQEDATNRDVHYARNRIRHVLLPLLESEFNPAVRRRLAELAEIARVEEDHWSTLLRDIRATDAQTSLDVQQLISLPPALQRRVIRAKGEELSLQLDFETIDAIQQFANGDGAELELPGGWRLIREIARRPSGGRSGVSLRFEKTKQPSSTNYKYTLRWPGEVTISELDIALVIRPVGALLDGTKRENTSESAVGSGYNLSQLLDPQMLHPELTVRNWQAGDRFWPANTSGPRKVKELLQRRHISGAARALWPVVLSGDEIVWMRGFPISENHRLRKGEQGLLIEEAGQAAVTE